MPWDWKGGKIDSGVYDNVLPDADPHKYVARRVYIYVYVCMYVFMYV
jgi:hypothetical protein